MVNQSMTEHNLIIMSFNAMATFEAALFEDLRAVFKSDETTGADSLGNNPHRPLATTAVSMAAVTSDSPSPITDNGHYSPQRGIKPPFAQALMTEPPQPAASMAATATPPALTTTSTTSVGGRGSHHHWHQWQRQQLLSPNVYRRSDIASGVALFAADQQHSPHILTFIISFICII